MNRKFRYICITEHTDIPILNSIPIFPVYLYVYVPHIPTNMETMGTAISDGFCCNNLKIDQTDPTHSKKRTTCSGLMKTALNNVVLPTLFNVVNNIVQHH